MKKIRFYGKRGIGKVFTIDPEDEKMVSKHRWYYQIANKKSGSYPYVYTMVGKHHLRLHRYLMDCPDGMVVDHINHDTLDNRRSNLRVCTPTQNKQNMKPQKSIQSKYKGVSIKQNGKWQAAIMADTKFHYIGTFDTERDAAVAYNFASKMLHKEYGILNDIDY